MNIGIDIDGVLTDLERMVIDFGTKNLAKLTEEEIAIATSKGWTLS